MKTKFSIILSSLALAMSVGAGLSISNRNKSAEPVEAIGNYSTDADTYYNSITASSGKELAAQLHDLITSTHRYYTSYADNGGNGYQKYTDQYYENGTAQSGYIYEFYSGVKWPNGWYPSSGNTQGGYNREHCWCQSLSVPANLSNTKDNRLWGEDGGGADMHHLRPVEVDLNSTRGNNLYGLVSNRDSYKKYAQLGSNETYAHGGYLNGGVFEPLDSKKGDVARIILYTYIHYNSYEISDLFGSYGTTNGTTKSYFATSSTGKLALTRVIKTSAGTEAAAVALLLQWNTSDPVDDIERRRNEQVAVYQGNRNPFIDNSSYADAIWGTSTPGITSISKTSATLTTGNTTTISAVSSNSGTITWSTSNSNICSISSNSASSGSSITLTAGNTTGTATITASITISGTTYSKTCAVTVNAPKTLESIAISGQQTSFTVGDEFSFGGTVTATYTDSSTANVTGSASFSGYNMSTTGTQTVTVSYTENGTKTTTYQITVSQASSSETASSTISYQDIPDGFATNGTSGSFAKTVVTSNDLTINYSGINTKSSATAADHAYGYAMFKGNYGYLYSSTCPSGYYPSSITVTFGSNTGTSGRAGIIYGSSILSSRDSSVSGAVSKGGTCALTNSDSSKLYWNFSTTGANVQVDNIVVVYTLIDSGSTSPTLSSITLNTTNVLKTFDVGDTFNYDGLIVTAHYSDSSTEDLDSYDISEPDMSTSGSKTITVSYGGESATYSITVNAAEVTLSSITVSNQKTQYYVGDTFVKPTVTAHYSDSSTADVTNSASFTGYNLSAAGNYTVTVSYTNGTTKTTTYSITVSAVELSSISVSTAPTKTTYTVGEYFDPTGLVITRTYNNGSSDTYTYANHTADFTFSPTTSTALSISNTSVTISYGGKSTSQTITVSASAPSGPSQRISASTTSGNYQSGDICPTGSTTSATASCDAFDVSWLKNSGSNIAYTFAEMRVYQNHSFTITPKTDYTITSVVITCDDNSATYPTNIGGSSLNNCTKDVSGVTVTLTPTNGSNAVGFTNNAQSRIDYIVVYYSQSGSSSEPSVSWSAPTINVYSGSTLSGSDVNSWAVTYNDGAGHQTVLTYSQLTVKLGGTTISIPHNWVAADDGKTLTATYNSLTTSESSAVQVTQAINAVTFEGEATYTHTSTSKWSSHSTAQTLSGVSWTPSITWSTTEPASGVQSVDRTKGQQIGTGSNPARVVNLSTSEIGGTISSIVVNASTASSATASISIKVGGSSFGGNAKSLSTSAANYTFEGSASGTVEIILSQPSTSKALYLKSITIGYAANANIANKTEHIEAQRLAVLFAKTFNEFMDDTQNCTTGLDAAWASCSTAYTLFKSSAASLGETEEAWCLNLIKYATAQYSDDSGEACIERMLKTYEICVQKHGKNAFMSDLITLDSNTVSPLVNISSNNKSTIIIVIISLISASTIAGYFFIKRRKPE